MSKIIVAFSIACACAAGAFADHGANEQWQTPWFNAIGLQSGSATSLQTTNGTWNLGTGATYNKTDKTIVLDQEDGVVSTFTIGNAYTPIDTGTIVEIKAKAIFYPVLSGDLAIPEGAKVTFAVVKEGSELSYRGWVTNGTSSTWTKFTTLGTPTADTETSVLITLNYRTKKATFTIGGNTSAELTIDDDVANVNPTGFSIAGCGTIKAVDGEVQYNVASYDGVGYATLGDAVTAAEEDEKTGEAKPVNVLRETDENVSITEDGVVINDNGKVKGEIGVADNVQVDVKPTADDFKDDNNQITSGEYTISTAVSGGKVEVVLPAEVATVKEIASTERDGSSINVTIRTKDSIVASSGTGKGFSLKCDNDHSGLRDYLTAHAHTVYEGAYSTAEAAETAIGNALDTTKDNGLKLWQNYTLGIEPTDSVKPLASPAGLTIPAIDTLKYSGDYTITYKAGSETAVTTPHSIPIPTSTGTHEIKIVLTPKAN